MAFEQREMSGGLFKNSKKEKDKHPDYTGECKIDGTTYRISAWLKDGQKGKWMSLSFQLPQERPTNSNARKDTKREDMDVPF